MLGVRARSLSERGAEFIANFEGFRADAYWDINHWSIGYGTPAREGEGPITRTEGMRRLRKAVNDHYAPAVRDVGVALNVNQFDALTSFAYNLGPGVLEADRPVGAALRRSDFEEAGDAMQVYNTAGGQVLAGLTRRRQEERALLLHRPPVGYTSEERYLLKVLRDKDASLVRRERASVTLRGRARAIQMHARRERNGWAKHDRGRRYQGIRRAVRRFEA